MASTTSSKALRPITSQLRGVFAGSGSDGLNEPPICEEVLRLTGKATEPARVTLAYLGTATYDLQGPMQRQTGWFAAKGCKVVPIVLGRQQSLHPNDGLIASKALATADIVLVSGGNTLYALERWKMAGITSALQGCMDRGAVICGGSAGAICWFDAGHSDSLDPDTFREAMLAAAEASSTKPKDESSVAPESAAERKSWRYARVSSLGFLPGLVCPHYDKTQSNGVPRAEDFDVMIRRHHGERGIGIDHWAALIVEGTHYHVLSLPNKPGSVAGCQADDFTSITTATYAPNQSGIPGVWTKTVNKDGTVATHLVPWRGELGELLSEPTAIVADRLEEEGKRMNPAQPDGMVMEVV
jgi:dipeptidase E